MEYLTAFHPGRGRGSLETETCDEENVFTKTGVSEVAGVHIFIYQRRVYLDARYIPWLHWAVTGVSLGVLACHLRMFLMNHFFC